MLARQVLPQGVQVRPPRDFGRQNQIYAIGQAREAALHVGHDGGNVFGRIASQSQDRKPARLGNGHDHVGFVREPEDGMAYAQAVA